MQKRRGSRNTGLLFVVFYYPVPVAVTLILNLLPLYKAIGTVALAGVDEPW
jgi:hypothetical protein